MSTNIVINTVNRFQTPFGIQTVITTSTVRLCACAPRRRFFSAQNLCILFGFSIGVGIALLFSVPTSVSRAPRSDDE